MPKYPTKKAIAWMIENGIDPDGDGWKPDVSPEESAAIIRVYDPEVDGPVIFFVEGDESLDKEVKD